MQHTHTHTQRVNPCFQPLILKLFRPNGISQKSARWIIWKLTEIYFGHRCSKLVGSTLDQALLDQAEPEQDEPAVTVIVRNPENATPDEIMASMIKRAHEFGLDTPEGLAKSLEPEPWEKE